MRTPLKGKLVGTALGGPHLFFRDPHYAKVGSGVASPALPQRSKLMAQGRPMWRFTQSGDVVTVSLIGGKAGPRVVRAKATYPVDGTRGDRVKAIHECLDRGDLSQRFVAAIKGV